MVGVEKTSKEILDGCQKYYESKGYTTMERTEDYWRGVRQIT